MSAPWKSVLIVAVLCVAVGPAADPPKPVQLPLTPFEVLALVHTETSDDAVIRKLKESGTRFPPGAPELRQLRQLGVSDKVLVAVTTEPPVQAMPAKMGRAVGTWVREVGPLRIVMKFTEDRLTVTANVPGPDGDECVLTADADYSVNPEGLMFGVISGIDADIVEAAPEIQMLTGHTFSARCRVDGTVMTVKDLKAFGSGLKMNGEQDDFASAMQMACGRYTRDDNAKPVSPKKAKPRAEKGSGFGAALGQMLGTSLGAAIGQAVGQAPPPYTLPPVAYGPPSVVYDMLHPGAIVTALPQPVPSFPPPPMMAPPPPPMPGGVVPAGWTVYPNSPMSPSPPMMASPAMPSKLVGSWIREMDGMQVTAKFTEKRAFLTVNMAFFERNQEHRMTLCIEADYAVGPDGTAFGVITATDFTPPKGEPTRREMEREMTSEMLAVLNGSPFCVRFRIDEGNLNIRELRCGEFSHRNPNAMALVGCYKPLGNQNPSPPKPVQMKLNESGPSSPPVSSGGIVPSASFERIGIDFDINLGGVGGMTLSSPHYLKHYPQYFPVGPAFPLQRELDSMIPVPEMAPAPRVR